MYNLGKIAKTYFRTLVLFKFSNSISKEVCTKKLKSKSKAGNDNGKIKVIKKHI